MGGFDFPTDTFFNYSYEDEWLTDEISMQMIEDIDHSMVVGSNVVLSSVFGPIPPSRLSGGVKTLILIAHDSMHIFNASACGDNCSKWLLEIGREKDVTVRLGYLMHFDEDYFEIRIVNNGRIIHNQKELVDAVITDDLLRRSWP